MTRTIRSDMCFHRASSEQPKRLTRCSEQLRASSRQAGTSAATFPPTMQVPRRTPLSLSLGSLGDIPVRTLISFLILCGTSTGFAGWTSSVRPDDDRFSPARASIAYVEDGGLPAFKDALNKLAQSDHIQRLEFIELHWLVSDSTFQHEVFSALEQSVPRELDAAKRSAGNMHNPKMTALRAPFAQAVLATPTVTKINTELARFGLRVSRIDQEKLSLIRDDKGQQQFICFLWLIVSPTKHQ